MKNLPIYDAILCEEEDGVQAISLVQSPAIEVNFLAFNESKQNLTFAVQSNDEQIIVTPIMIADKLIYRIAPNGEEYYIRYTPQVIKEMMQKFMRENRTNQVNIEHTYLFPNGLFLYESYIVDENKKAPKELGDISNGSWMGAFKIDNDSIWNEIKLGTFKGVSLEGYFGVVEASLSIEEEILSVYKELCKIK